MKEKPPKIDVAFLRRYPEFLLFSKKTASKEEEKTTDANVIQSTPHEIMEEAYQRLRRTLAQELLDKVKTMTPSFFERLVVELLVKMGYGGSLQDAGRATRQTHDGGIDGIIKEDKLGLDVIYIQAKKYTSNAVGRTDLQAFVGALDGQRANKGIFITTSSFNSNAVEYVRNITKKVVLIDGEQLAEYMIDHGLGVSPLVAYELKRIDSDYFGE